MSNGYYYRKDWYWRNTEELERKSYTCYNCGEKVLSNEGYYADGRMFDEGDKGRIYICHNCKVPTYFILGNQIPGAIYGMEVNYLPDDINIAYTEARKCFSVDAFTSSVLCCRKILMSIACEKGADEGKKFEYYVDYLNTNSYIPPNGREWVDRIRKLGNQATHKLEMKSKEDAELAITFTSMLLKFIYEFPKLLEG